MLNDLRFAARLLTKDWGFTVAAAAALAIGLCGTITMFTLIYGVYLRDLPFEHPDRIVGIGMRPPMAPPEEIGGFSWPDLEDAQASLTEFDGIGAARETSMDVSDDERAAEQSRGAFVSPNAFDLIGKQPVLGRGFTADDNRPGAPPVVILGYRLWQRRYGGDPAIIGASVRVDAVTATVIGVMPEGFGFPMNSELWLPFGLRGEEVNQNRGLRTLDAFARLAPGVSREQATADLERFVNQLAREYPLTNANLAASVRPFRERNTGGALRTVFAALMGSVALLLLIACANVANLLLARGATRAREITVRLSLGASRAQIVRQLLAESLLLAVISGAAGLGLAAVGVRLFRDAVRGTGEPYWLEFPIEGWVFAFAGGVCLVTTVLCGLAPALQTSKASLAGVLSEAGRGTAGTRRARRWTDAFVVVQIALGLTLLAAAGLMMRNVVAFATVDVGVETGDLITATVALPTARYPDDNARGAFYRQLGERLAAEPGLRAGFASAPPLLGAPPQRVLVEGRPRPAEGDEPIALGVTVGPGYFETLGVQPVRGRLFEPADDGSASRLVVVNERFAELHFPDGDAVGRAIRLWPAIGPGSPGEPLTIVGVVPNVRQVGPRRGGDSRVAGPVAYVPYAAAPLPNATILARVSGGGAAVPAALREAVAAIDRDLPVTGVQRLEDALSQELWLLTVFSSMFGLFAAAALGMTAVGLYAVTAFAVAQRTREVGLRIALGARARHVWWTVTRRAALQVACGLALGLAGALAAGDLLRTLLSGVGSRDPVTLVGVPAVMIAVAVAACVVPARRAMRLDPAAALRSE